MWLKTPFLLENLWWKVYLKLECHRVKRLKRWRPDSHEFCNWSGCTQWDLFLQTPAGDITYIKSTWLSYLHPILYCPPTQTTVNLKGEEKKTLKNKRPGLYCRGKIGQLGLTSLYHPTLWPTALCAFPEHGSGKSE